MCKRVGLILTILAFLTLSSCTRVFLWLNHAHLPRPESKLDLLNYLHKKKLSVNNILFLKNETDWLKLGKYNADIICFNKDQNYYWHRDSTSCNAPTFLYCENICQTEIPTERVNSNFGLDSLLKLTEDFNGNAPLRTDADYTVFIGWSKWSGKLNGDHIKVWDETLEKAGCKVKVYKLCLDPLKEWGPSTFTISKKFHSNRRNKKGEVIKRS